MFDIKAQEVCEDCRTGKHVYHLIWDLAELWIEENKKGQLIFKGNASDKEILKLFFNFIVSKQKENT